MPIPRKEQVNLDITPCYHCMSRCAQQCFLLGKDKHTGHDFSHRKIWIEKRIIVQAEAFAISVCAYAIMSNHLHLVLRVDRSKALKWTEQQVCTQWQKISKLPAHVEKFLAGKPQSEFLKRKAKFQISRYRRLLFDISTFMGMLKWYISIKSNKEMGRKGHFWDNRFHSQALLNDSALLSCMVYVDLNPLRAGVAKSLETSDYTSFFQRHNHKNANSEPSFLAKFGVLEEQAQLPCALSDYFKIIKLSAHLVIEKSDVKEPITLSLPKGIRKKRWKSLIHRFESLFDFAVGSEQELVQFKRQIGRVRIRGRTQAIEHFV